MKARAAVAGVLLGFAAAASAQTLTTFVQSPSGGNTVALGYPVPLPVESLTAVDGFRSHASLRARLLELDLASPDLGVVAIGTTHAGRTLEACVLGDADALTVDGFAEPAMLVNAATHAREWQAPEVAVGVVEYLVAHAAERGFARYVLDNARVVVVPVQNLDGFLQTQRYPNQTLVGLDPTVTSWPRDGRMRRKNMPGVDQILTTTADHLRGVDLNRNHLPYFGGGSGDPDNLTYYGAGPHSEPENQALDAALALAGAARLRYAQDTHSFGQVLFSANTGLARLNAIQSRLATTLRGHQLARSGRNYREARDPPNAGIGTAAEWLGNTFLVPAWTLELEPVSSSQEYGGLGYHHDGFVLPDAQIRRVRDAWATSQALAFYMMAGPPYLERLQIDDAASGEPRRVLRWVRSGAGRALLVEREAPLLAGRNYRFTFGFNKAMRVAGAGGAAGGLDGVAIAVQPTIALQVGGAALPTSDARWLDDPARVARYAFDSYELTAALPVSATGELAATVDAVDLSTLRLDADPATPVDWAPGYWTGYENEGGVAGDSGGIDGAMRARVDASEASRVLIGTSLTRLDAGRATRLQLQRLGGGAALTLAARVVPLDANADSGALQLPQGDRVSWGDGESGLRRLVIEARADADVQAAARYAIQLEAVNGTVRLDAASVVITIAPRSAREP